MPTRQISGQRYNRAQEKRRSTLMNIGFVSTRFSGTDGVTLEASKWAQVFQRNGYSCYWFAGELDRNPSMGYLAPEAHFQADINIRINEAVMGQRQRSPKTSELIHSQRLVLKNHLYRFIQKFHIDFLIVENVLSLPMQIPLGLALTEVLAETQIPTIAHHHDFSWERDRYTVNAAADYIQTAFPPKLPNIAHVVINSTAREEMARRTGIVSTVVPNVLDFENPPQMDAQAVQSFRDSIGLRSEDLMILQPTRIVQRKGIEHAINLVKALNLPNCKLVISHQAGDEGLDYASWLNTYAQSQEVDLVFVQTHLCDPWGTDACHYPQFSLNDIYPSADFVTYPSLSEGFGNGLLEAVYFNKPLLVNRYATYIKDIEPLGFGMVSINGFLTAEAVEQVARILSSPQSRDEITARNYDLGRRHFSYQTLQGKLNRVLFDLFGDDFQELSTDEDRRKEVTDRQPESTVHDLTAQVKWAQAYN